MCADRSREGGGEGSKDLSELALRAALETRDLMALVLEALEGLKQQPEKRTELKRQEELILAAAARAIGDARRDWVASANDARSQTESTAPGAQRLRERPARQEPPMEMLERIEAEFSAINQLEATIRHFDRAAVVLELADRSRYTSALVLLVAIRRTLLRAQDAHMARRFIQLAMDGKKTPIAELNDFLRPALEAGPYDPARLSDEQNAHLPVLGVVLAMLQNQDDIWEKDPLLEAAKLTAELCADDWGHNAIRAIPPSGPVFTRAHWARWMRDLVSKALALSEEDALRLGAMSDPAARQVGGIVAGLRSAAPIPELRDLVVQYVNPEEHRRRCDAAVRKVREYLESTSTPDAEAIIRRVLLAFGYEPRKAHSLFESIDIAEKRRATKGPQR